jgi:hypothetical protein
MIFLYGPQSPSGFCNGPTCAELQGEMVIEMIEHVTNSGKARIEPTPDADEAWSQHVRELVEPTLFPLAKSWYMGANIPGKAIQSLNYPGGLISYRTKYAEAKDRDYAGFIVS